MQASPAATAHPFGDESQFESVLFWDATRGTKHRHLFVGQKISLTRRPDVCSISSACCELSTEISALYVADMTTETSRIPVTGQRECYKNSGFLDIGDNVSRCFDRCVLKRMLNLCRRHRTSCEFFYDDTFRLYRAGMSKSPIIDIFSCQ